MLEEEPLTIHYGILPCPAAAENAVDEGNASNPKTSLEIETTAVIANAQEVSALRR
jgi:hypothetical protein